MIYQLPSYERAWRRLGPAERLRVNQAVGRLEAAFGRPHSHSGLGLRAFGRYWELRAGLDLRVLLLAEGGDFFLVTLGSHDELRAYLKHNR